MVGETLLIYYLSKLAEGYPQEQQMDDIPLARIMWCYIGVRLGLLKNTLWSAKIKMRQCWCVGT